VFEDLEKDKLTESSLMEVIRDSIKSDYLVMYFRFVTSAYLKTNVFLFEHFLENGITMDYFCQTEVEPLHRDAD